MFFKETIENISMVRSFVLEQETESESQSRLGLSEGQVQRLAIARAIYANRPILLLDEAASALDEATERQIITHIKEKTDCTLILISHRKTSISLCDTSYDIVANPKSK